MEYTNLGLSMRSPHPAVVCVFVVQWVVAFFEIGITIIMIENNNINNHKKKKKNSHSNDNENNDIIIMMVMIISK